MSEVLVDTVEVTDLLEVATTHELTSENEALEVLEYGTPEVVVETALAVEVIDATERTEVIETGTQGPPGPPGADGQVGSALDLSALPIAGAAAPEEIIVRQGNDWFRATFLQLRKWLGLLGITVNSQPVTVNGTNVTIGAD